MSRSIGQKPNRSPHNKDSQPFIQISYSNWLTYPELQD